MYVKALKFELTLRFLNWLYRTTLRDQYFVFQQIGGLCSSNDVATFIYPSRTGVCQATFEVVT